MERALVVVSDSDSSKSMVREAGELAAGVGADIVLYAEATEEDIGSVVENPETSVGGPGPGSADAIDNIHRFLDRVASEELADVDVDYETACSVVPSSGHAQSVLTIADEYDCDHLFLVGDRRTPTGKALFGDYVQSLLLNFDGTVTTDLV
ncbi:MULTISPECIES: universal stress protein [Haloarcula]|uniref:Universal stress protein UspA n=1 Tax=Haloarcula pellucida TaxID=1427151 RepID=A0A830GNV9_9EURY|nr:MULTISPECIES: universal stress protein [Halomicroarcula]MBX0349664.1 universal stress protein [Halomicroarcula pellucida]MDS0279807.1 universal stress protein [Halomicroarcula sp. S1AR25-4]GGN95789.1 universal stress protein UspA [Halomicroarcula pellucida]